MHFRKTTSIKYVNFIMNCRFYVYKLTCYLLVYRIYRGGVTISLLYTVLDLDAYYA